MRWYRADISLHRLPGHIHRLVNISRERKKAGCAAEQGLVLAARLGYQIGHGLAAFDDFHGLTFFEPFGEPGEIISQVANCCCLQNDTLVSQIGNVNSQVRRICLRFAGQLADSILRRMERSLGEIGRGAMLSPLPGLFRRTYDPQLRCGLLSYAAPQL